MGEDISVAVFAGGGEEICPHRDKRKPHRRSVLSSSGWVGVGRGDEYIWVAVLGRGVRIFPHIITNKSHIAN